MRLMNASSMKMDHSQTMLLTCHRVQDPPLIRDEPNNFDLTGYEPYYTLEQLEGTLNITYNSKYRANSVKGRYALFLQTTNKETRLNNIKILQYNLQNGSTLINIADLIQQNNDTRYSFEDLKKSFKNVGLDFKI